MFRSPERFGNYEGNQFAYRESHKFKNAIQELEALDVLTTQDRVLILATALDLKPASLVAIKTVDDETRRRLEHILSDLGVFFSEKQSPYESGISFVILGGTPETISAAFEAIDDGIKDKEFGTVMGFPDTAVKAYSNTYSSDMGSVDELLSLDEGDGKLTPEERNFSFFRLSKRHYQKEIEWVEQIAAATKLFGPTLYKKVLEKKYG